MGDSITITKKDVLAEIEAPIINELVDEFFDWMHGSGCDLVEEKLLIPIGQKIISKFENDAGFVEKLQATIIKQMETKTEVIDEIIANASKTASERLANKIIENYAKSKLK